MDKEEKNKLKAREKILSNHSGRFDFVDTVLLKEDLMTKPPRLLYAQLIDTLSLKSNDLTIDAFRAWLRRYKKGFQAREEILCRISNRPDIPRPKPIKLSDDIQKESSFIDDFKLTDPTTIEPKSPLSFIKEIKS